jgi:hypothetical protein
MTLSKPTSNPLSWVLFLFTVGTFAQGCVDKTNQPVLRLIGPDTVTALQGAAYVDRGVIAFDREDLDMSDQVEVIQGINTSELGFQEEIYRATDRHGNTSEISRTVWVIPSSLTCEGDYAASSNGFACSVDGLVVQIAPHLGQPDEMVISPVIGVGSSSMILHFEEGQWDIKNTSNLPCGVIILEADCRVSADGDTVAMLLYENAFPYYSSLIYIRQ